MCLVVRQAGEGTEPSETSSELADSSDTPLLLRTISSDTEAGATPPVLRKLQHQVNPIHLLSIPTSGVLHIHINYYSMMKIDNDFKNFTALALMIPILCFIIYLKIKQSLSPLCYQPKARTEHFDSSFLAQGVSHNMTYYVFQY